MLQNTRTQYKNTNRTSPSTKPTQIEHFFYFLDNASFIVKLKYEVFFLVKFSTIKILDRLEKLEITIPKKP